MKIGCRHCGAVTDLGGQEQMLKYARALQLARELEKACLELGDEFGLASEGEAGRFTCEFVPAQREDIDSCKKPDGEAAK